MGATGKDTVRTRIAVPGDEALPDDFYAERSGAAAREPLNQTAFRIAERKYKAAHTDYNDPAILDFSRETLHPAIYAVRGRTWRRSDGVELPVFGIRGVEGFYYVSGGVSEAEQLHYARQSFMAYPAHPNATNFTAHYVLPREGVYPYFRADATLEIPKTGSSESVRVAGSGEWEARFMRKMRWITLGYQYNWTSKEYNYDAADRAAGFPSDLAQWAVGAAQQLGFGTDYRPEAGIVNFYQLDDTLTGHVDRSERNMVAPLLSLSIGQSAIFLLGGPSRDDTPVYAIKVRSGDVSVLSGPSRHNFHGVPKVLPESAVDLGTPENLADADTAACLRLLKNCRININIRQVL